MTCLTTSWVFTQRAKESGLLPSMRSVGDADDNAVIESFWGRMQTELLNRQRWRTQIEYENSTPPTTWPDSRELRSTTRAQINWINRQGSAHRIRAAERPCALHIGATGSGEVVSSNVLESLDVRGLHQFDTAPARYSSPSACLIAAARSRPRDIKSARSGTCN